MRIMDQKDIDVHIAEIVHQKELQNLTVEQVNVVAFLMELAARKALEKEGVKQNGKIKKLRLQKSVAHR